MFFVVCRYGTSSAVVGGLNLAFEIKLYPDHNTSLAEAILLGFGWGQYHVVLEVRSPTVGLAMQLCCT